MRQSVHPLGVRQQTRHEYPWQSFEQGVGGLATHALAQTAAAHGRDQLDQHPLLVVVQVELQDVLLVVDHAEKIIGMLQLLFGQGAKTARSQGFGLGRTDRHLVHIVAVEDAIGMFGLQ